MQRTFKIAEDAFIRYLSRIKQTELYHNNISRNLKESSDRYRIYKNLYYHLAFIDKELPNKLRTECIACCNDYSQPNKRCKERWMYDGTFSLNRVDNTTYHREPILVDNHFMDQKLIDAAVNIYKPSKILSNCNFTAMKEISSKSKYAGLDETGIGGIICSHNSPIKFCNFKTGEQFVYLDEMLKYLFNENSDRKVLISYDVSCKYGSHFVVFLI